MVAFFGRLGSRASEDGVLPTFPAFVVGTPVSAWTCLIHLVGVVLHFVLVTAMNWLGMSRHASSSSPSIGVPRSRATWMTGAFWGTSGLLMSVLARAARSTPDASRRISTP